VGGCQLCRGREGRRHDSDDDDDDDHDDMMIALSDISCEAV
jgi:hypothetical protein